MISWTTADGICELVLDSPPCNELGTELLSELEQFVSELDLTQTQALIIRSAQPAGFSAGAALKELHESIDGRENHEWMPELRGFINRIHALMDRLDTLPITTIGVIHGVCFGGGFELALTCDVRIVEKTARFAFPELRLGIIPGFGGVPRLRRDCGNAAVRDLLMTGRSINAKKAVTLGLASQMVPAGAGAEAARRLGAQCRKYDSETMRTAKAFMKPLPAAELAKEKEIFIRLFDRPVVREALRAFYESTDVRPYLA